MNVQNFLDYKDKCFLCGEELYFQTFFGALSKKGENKKSEEMGRGKIENNSLIFQCSFEPIISLNTNSVKYGRLKTFSPNHRIEIGLKQTCFNEKCCDYCYVSNLVITKNDYTIQSISNIFLNYNLCIEIFDDHTNIIYFDKYPFKTIRYPKFDINNMTIDELNKKLKTYQLFE